MIMRHPFPTKVLTPYVIMDLAGHLMTFIDDVLLPAISNKPINLFYTNISLMEAGTSNLCGYCTRTNDSRPDGNKNSVPDKKSKLGALFELTTIPDVSRKEVLVDMYDFRFLNSSFHYYSYTITCINRPEFLYIIV